MLDNIRMKIHSCRDKSQNLVSNGKNLVNEEKNSNFCWDKLDDLNLINLPVPQNHILTKKCGIYKKYKEGSKNHI